MSKIPLTRIRLYLIILGLVPILAASLVLRNRLHHIHQMEEELWDLGQKIAQKEMRLAPNRRVRAAHMGADHFWVDKELETYTPLQPERDALERLASWGLPSPEGKRRLAFLQGKENRPLFTETALHKEGKMEEVVESSAHPIQVDVDDLKALLSALEGPSDVPRPQTLITDFKLKRKGLEGGDEVFNLELKFVKREFLP